VEGISRTISLPPGTIGRCALRSAREAPRRRQDAKAASRSSDQRRQLAEPGQVTASVSRRPCGQFAASPSVKGCPAVPRKRQSRDRRGPSRRSDCEVRPTTNSAAPWVEHFASCRRGLARPPRWRSRQRGRLLRPSHLGKVAAQVLIVIGIPRLVSLAMSCLFADAIISGSSYLPHVFYDAGARRHSGAVVGAGSNICLPRAITGTHRDPTRSLRP